MSAHAQALLIQLVAFILANTILDGGRILNAVLVSCLLFWGTAGVLFLYRRGSFSALDRVFLRWGSLPFLLIGTPLLMPVVESFLRLILRPADNAGVNSVERPSMRIFGALIVFFAPVLVCLCIRDLLGHETMAEWEIVAES